MLFYLLSAVAGAIVALAIYILAHKASMKGRGEAIIQKAEIEAESIKHISISNMLGQVVFDGKVGGDAFEYDFSGQKAGIYLVRIETASGVAVKKVSITR